MRYFYPTAPPTAAFRHFFGCAGVPPWPWPRFARWAFASSVVLPRWSLRPLSPGRPGCRPCCCRWEVRGWGGGIPGYSTPPQKRTESLEAAFSDDVLSYLLLFTSLEILIRCQTVFSIWTEVSLQCHRAQHSLKTTHYCAFLSAKLS